MSVPTEPVAEDATREYLRLVRAYAHLSGIVREAAGPVDDAKARLRSIDARMRELLAIPPTGYALPPAAAQLTATASANGWRALVQWTSPVYTGAPFVSVQVGRLLRKGEHPEARGDRWKYTVTWHARGCPEGRVRLFGRRLAITPECPWTHDGPSVKGIRAVIEQHPAPREGRAAA